jgi:hypothetical protein
MRERSNAWSGVSEGIAAQPPSGRAGQLAAVEGAVAQRHGPVRAEIPEREDRPLGAAAEQHGLAEQAPGQGAAGLECRRRRGQIPEILEEGGAARPHGGPLGPVDIQAAVVAGAIFRQG